jgi:cytoskeletal protein CcmA (bactofilin family)
MWKRRNEDDLIEEPPQPVTRPGPATPASVPAAPPAAPRLTRSEATIGKSVLIKGQITSDEDIHLEGQVEGTLDLPKNRLTVGKSGRIQASIRAREVDVHGTVHGNIDATEKITIRSNANLVGDLRSATISIEDGAYFKGSIDIVRQPPGKPEAAPAPARPAAGPTPNAARTTPAQSGAGN